mmetsp:Transcript_8635/g.12194  ORF Transcript_8635/g.12194 Transcript_8635/m.12194 type:complete len:518 (-) Transcript_8635:95-1648(-)
MLQDNLGIHACEECSRGKDICRGMNTEIEEGLKQKEFREDKDDVKPKESKRKEKVKKKMKKRRKKGKSLEKEKANHKNFEVVKIKEDPPGFKSRKVKRKQKGKRKRNSLCRSPSAHAENVPSKCEGSNSTYTKNKKRKSDECVRKKMKNNCEKEAGDGNLPPLPRSKAYALLQRRMPKNMSQMEANEISIGSKQSVSKPVSKPALPPKSDTLEESQKELGLKHVKETNAEMLKNTATPASKHIQFEEDENGILIRNEISKNDGGARQNTLSIFWTQHKMKQRRILEDRYRKQGKLNNCSRSSEEQDHRGYNEEYFNESEREDQPKNKNEHSSYSSSQAWVSKDLGALREQVVKGIDKFGKDFYAPRHLTYLGVGTRGDATKRQHSASDYSEYPRLVAFKDRSQGFLDEKGKFFYPSPGDIYALKCIELINWAPCVTDFEEYTIKAFEPLRAQFICSKVDGKDIIKKLDEIAEIRLVHEVKDRIQPPAASKGDDLLRHVLHKLHLRRLEIENLGKQKK